MTRGIATNVIDELLTKTEDISATQVAKEAGISRQAAHRTLRTLVKAGALEVSGRARASRYLRPRLLPGLRCVRLEVASAGSLYRLSARLLLAELDANDVTLDFRGVSNVGEEFLEEVFSLWKQAHPDVRLNVVNVAPALRQKVYSAGARG